MASRKERLAVCFDIIGREFKKCACGCEGFPKDFSIKDTSVMQLLGERPMMMSELAVELDLTPGTMTTKIDNMIKKKIVERVLDEDDRRKVFIKLTSKGQKIADVINDSHLQLAGALLKKLDSAEQEQFVKLSEKLIS